MLVNTSYAQCFEFWRPWLAGVFCVVAIIAILAPIGAKVATRRERHAILTPRKVQWCWCVAALAWGLLLAGGSIYGLWPFNDYCHQRKWCFFCGAKATLRGTTTEPSVWLCSDCSEHDNKFLLQMLRSASSDVGKQAAVLTFEDGTRGHYRPDQYRSGAVSGPAPTWFLTWSWLLTLALALPLLLSIFLLRRGYNMLEYEL